MKRITIIITVFIFLVQCSTSKKVQYEFPAAMSEPVRTGYKAQCEKGEILYDINCAKCHNTKMKKREIIPDFTEEQLVGYELRMLNPKHEEGIPETNVTAEELGLIMTFLKYKKKKTL
jgi:hypothetical protein